MRPYIDRLILPDDAPPEFRFSGSTEEAGRSFARWTLANYPYFPYYLAQAVHTWEAPSADMQALFAHYAPWIPRFYQGMLAYLKTQSFDADAPRPPLPVRKPLSDCSSFSVDAALCEGNHPLSGQTKDTEIDSMDLYIVLNLKLTDGPSILTLSYPGELLGYGFWSNGMSVFRNNLRSSAESASGLPFFIFGLLAMSSGSVEEIKRLAGQYEIAGMGHMMFSDPQSAVSVEYNAGGISLIERQNGLLVHSNHPIGEATRRFITTEADYLAASESRRDMLTKSILALPHPISVSGLHQALSTHHQRDNWGVCRHGDLTGTDYCTTASVVADVVSGTLHVTKGPACLSDFHSYTMQ